MCRRVKMRKRMEKMKGREDVEKSKNERSSGGEREREVWRKERLMMRDGAEKS
jgi:hypothetical protein